MRVTCKGEGPLRIDRLCNPSGDNGGLGSTWSVAENEQRDAGYQDANQAG